MVLTGYCQFPVLRVKHIGLANLLDLPAFLNSTTGADKQMKKIIIALCALILCFGLVACNETKESGPSIAVVDAARVFKDCKSGLEAMNYLKDMSQELQAEARAAQEAVQKEQNEENTVAFQKALAKYQTKMGAEQQRIVGILNEKFNEILDKYRADHNLSVVLSKDNALSFNDDADITGKIIAEMDKLEIDIKAGAPEEKVEEKAAAPEEMTQEKAEETPEQTEEKTSE